MPGPQYEVATPSTPLPFSNASWLPEPASDGGARIPVSSTDATVPTSFWARSSDLELEYDEPAVDHCGSCTRCLEACPTDAFPEPYVLDSRRCISYLTIELKGAIPVDLRHDMGSWIFGCDICQDVCPWNKQPTPTREPALEPRDGLDNPSLTRILGMDRDAFNAQFRHNPVKRAKRRGLLRNTAVALGNSGSPAAIPALIDALNDDEPLIRGHAAWALGKLGGTEAETALKNALDSEADAEVIAEIERAIEMLS